LHRTTCGGRARSCATIRGGELEQIQFLLGHASVQTTERYLGCKQNLGHPVNDLFDLGTDGQQQEKDEEFVSADGTSEAVEKAFGQGIGCGHGGSEHERPICDPKHVSVPERTDVVEIGKAIARKAFDAALGQELHEVIQEAKRMANEIQKSSNLWDLEHHLTQRRKEIDRKYDFRGSRLTDVLGRLLYENRLGEEDLRGLQEEKMKSIRSFAQFLRDGAA
jgi:hypothetical protein